MDVFCHPPSSTFFFKRIKSDAPRQHGRRVSTGGRNSTNLELANDIDALAEEEQELEALKVSTKPAQGIRWRSVLRRSG